MKWGYSRRLERLIFLQNSEGTPKVFIAIDVDHVASRIPLTELRPLSTCIQKLLREASSYAIAASASADSGSITHVGWLDGSCSILMQKGLGYAPSAQ